MSTSSHNLGGQEPLEEATTIREEEFYEAVERIYRKYGSDLTAFVQDVQRDMQRVQQERNAGIMEPHAEDLSDSSKHELQA